MTEFAKLVAAYSRLTRQELLDCYELKDLLEPAQVRAIVFAFNRLDEQKAARLAAAGAGINSVFG